MVKINYKDSDLVYNPNDIEHVLNISVNDKNLKGNNKGVYTYNIPASFDIETTSFYRDTDGKQYDYNQVSEIREKTGDNVKFEKISIMYVWQFGINGNIIVGRTWQEFTDMMARLTEILQLHSKKKLIIYVHNLAYEFQFIRNLFKWEKVFSIDMRKPIYANTTSFFEFRCSYLLSGYSLANLTKQMVNNTITKKVGDLDYSLIRHSETVLTDLEMGYCIDDIKIIMVYIQDLINQNGGIERLPLTKTGFVRRFCKEQCLYVNEGKKKGRNWSYIGLVEELRISNLEEFDALQRAFSGGFTHANAFYTDSVVENVSSYDFNSSYPYVMVAEQFPMSAGVHVTVKDKKHFDFLMQKYCCVFNIEFVDLIAKQTQDNPISVSKCFKKKNVVDNNGRVVSADSVIMTITNVDFEIFEKFYTWGGLKIDKMYCYKKAYLPTEFVDAILSLYSKKTTLKGVEGREQEYMLSKEMLNSCYGMCVTNPLRDEYTYNDVEEWGIKENDENEREEALFKHNNSKNRFLYYPWGVFVTAYARRNLFTAIDQCKEDYVYSDTDSVKITNADKYKDYFSNYNKEVIRKLNEACIFHEIDFEACNPKTIEGESKLLGVWDFEGVYRRFKTLGAKRYMIEQDNALKTKNQVYEYSLTVSGVNKNSAIPYLYNLHKDNIFEAFTNYLHLPPEATAKKIHTYIDYPTFGTLTDYNGKSGIFTEMNGIHLEPTSYSLSLSVLYLQHLTNINIKE